RDLYAPGGYLRTGDLGRLDGDGYLFITGRQKDLIIRGGHNIDPAEIEEALLSHPEVSFAGAIGQPDAVAGELPCAYVELLGDATVSPEALLAHVTPRIAERAALPKHIEVMGELPKTAVGKVFKPDLRRLAIARVFDAALRDAGVTAHVAEVVEDRKRGLVARISKDSTATEADIGAVLDHFTTSWELAGRSGDHP
ncbi:MAG: AMP-binding protein, partial [Rhodobacteraceae bacterium]|nr:AMP-binding protein [Paracoccaceae bacterium]